MATCKRSGNSSYQYRDLWRASRSIVSMCKRSGWSNWNLYVQLQLSLDIQRKTTCRYSNTAQGYIIGPPTRRIQWTWDTCAGKQNSVKMFIQYKLNNASSVGFLLEPKKGCRFIENKHPGNFRQQQSNIGSVTPLKQKHEVSNQLPYIILVQI